MAWKYTLCTALISLSLAACGDGAKTKMAPDGDAGTTPVEAGANGASGDAGLECPPPAGDAESGPKHRLLVTAALVPDGKEGVPFFTQNISKVHVPVDAIAGAKVAWLTAPGGEQLANADVLEFGTTTVGEDLTFEIETTAIYADGPYELGVVVYASGGEIAGGPKEGDLASFSLLPAPPCDPPITGTSVRFVVDGKDAQVSLGNTEFIRF